METILLIHAEKYPLMEPRDAVKLVFQNEFGGGHLIRDEQACLNRLLEEYRSTPQQPDIPLTEDIGDGLVRVNLAALDDAGMSPHILGQAFIVSAAAHRGCLDSFLKKLATLTNLTDAGKMPFSPSDLKAYLADYETAGFPPVSHSDTYRNAYHPAYRVVQTEHLPRQTL